LSCNNLLGSSWNIGDIVRGPHRKYRQNDIFRETFDCRLLATFTVCGSVNNGRCPLGD